MWIWKISTSLFSIHYNFDQNLKKKSELKMTNINYPSATPQGQEPKSSNTKNIIIGFLAVALLGTWAYLLLNKNKTDKEIQAKTEEGVKYMTQRDSVEVLYKFTLENYDSVTIANNDLQGKLTGKQSEISKLKSEIGAILKKQNATTEELNTAKSKISQLNNSIANLEAEVNRLTGENKQLTTANTQLTQDKQNLETNLAATQGEKKVLEETVDVGSTFSASNIQITAINEKRSGKEKEITAAKRVDKLVVSFDVENRIAKSGPADMYIMVTAPDGKVISSEATGGATLTTRQDGDKLYTSKVVINYDQGKRQNVQLPLHLDKFQKGDYRIQVYHNGLKIGEGVRTLK
jgi:myosin heavy subunit